MTPFPQELPGFSGPILWMAQLQRLCGYQGTWWVSEGPPNLPRRKFCLPHSKKQLRASVGGWGQDM